MVLEAIKIEPIFSKNRNSKVIYLLAYRLKKFHFEFVATFAYLQTNEHIPYLYTS